MANNSQSQQEGKQAGDKGMVKEEESKNVAIIGSTGGGAASLGGGEGLGLITAITKQLHRAGIEVVAIQLVESTVSVRS